MPSTTRSTQALVFQTSPLQGVASRAGGAAQMQALRREAQPGRDVVAITLGNGLSADLTLYLAPEHARDLLRSQVPDAAPASARRDGGVPTAVPEGVLALPHRACWAMPGATPPGAAASRGLGADLVFKALDVLGLQGPATHQTAQWLGQKMDGGVCNGVHRLSSDGLAALSTETLLKELPAAPAGEPTLVLIHGTFVNTASTFGDWWREHPALVQEVFDAYDGRVYALDHPTMTCSPIGNALTLAQACPSGARLHLLTHSRGGLVAEVLARACSPQGLGDADQAAFPGADYAVHRKELRALSSLVKVKKLTVERVVRVACPAHGTVLASGRLDAYLSVFTWVLGLAGVPVLPELMAFVHAVARERSRPEVFPGIEAMLPGSPLVRWLNAPGAQVDGQLRVVAGDLEGDSLVSWVKTLLANSFYGVDNDLVVDTRAMYGGAPRSGEAVFRLERSGRAQHGSYFANESTATAIVQALVEAAPRGFKPIGPLSRQGLDASGQRGLLGTREDTRIRDALQHALAARGERPAVIVIPGILGSHLKGPQGREWFELSRLHGVMDRIAWEPSHNEILPDGPIDSFYADLVEHMGASHDVLAFDFDWRRPLENEGQRLAVVVQRELKRREASGQAVRVLAHSMGGLVARVMQLQAPQVWQDMMARQGARVVMLGTPNAGSWSPMTILTADDKLGRTLSSVAGFPFSEKRMRERAAAMPGLLQMQCGLLDEHLRLDQQSTWKDWAKRDLAAAREALSWHSEGLAEGVYEWAIPPQAVLDQARALNERLAAQGPVLRASAANMAVVLGQADRTACGVRWSEQGAMDYVVTSEGDGRVAWTSALIEGVSAWLVPASHGDLPKTEAAFDLYTALLSTGQGDARWSFMDSARGAVDKTLSARDAQALPAMRPSRWLLSSIDGGGAEQGDERGDALTSSDPAAVMGSLLRGFPCPAVSRARAATHVPPARIRVVNGDVRFVQQALLLGHTRSLQLTGAEKFVNPLIGGVLQSSLDLHLYPEEPGQVQIFINQHRDPDQPFALPRPEAVVVVGLGDEGDVDLPLLRQAVRDGVLAYARHVWTSRHDPSAAMDETGGFGLSALLMGSGSSATVWDSAQALAQGVADANRDIAMQPAAQRWPHLAQLDIIELYLNRATEAVYALVDGAAQLDGRIEIDTAIDVKHSGQTRPRGVGYRGADYDLIRICASDKQPDVLEYSLFTRRARSEIRAKATQPRLVDQMLVAAQADTGIDAELARSLYQLLLPAELQTHISAGHGLLLEVDVQTARYPWEMLDDAVHPSTGKADDSPLTVRRPGGLLRKMRVSDFRRQPRDAVAIDVPLVIGPPQLNDPNFAELPGAQAEAQAVAQVLRAEFGDVHLLQDATPLEVIKGALAKPRRIIHMAGHGTFVEGGESGMVLQGGTLLGPHEFESMAVVPELVFVNCCHLGAIRDDQSHDRHLFAASVAEQLIRNGVRCVVAAGWAVSDEPAKAFAQAFYAAVLGNQSFQEAVVLAREAAFDADPRCNTWAAYQCYGDPHWRLTPREGEQRAHRQAGVSKTARRTPRTRPMVCSGAEFELLLNDIQARAVDADEARRRDLSAELDLLMKEHGERFARDGRVLEVMGFTLLSLGRQDEAMSTLGHALCAEDGRATLRAREVWLNHRARMAGQPEQIREVIEGIHGLLSVGMSSERLCLLGSAWKRLAMLAQLGEAERYDAVCQIHEAYFQAEQLAPDNLHYPLSQRLWAQWRLHCWHKAHAAPTAQEVQALREAISRAEQRGGADFWSVVAQHETEVLDAVIQGDLQTRLPQVSAGLAQVHERVSLQRHWSSVHDQACFALRPYEAITRDPAEAQAVSALLEQLRAYAA